MSTSGGYHEYTGGCSVHQRNTMSISGGYHEYIGGYHEYIKGCSVHRGISHEYIRDVQYIGVSIEIERILSTCSPPCIMISP